MKKPLAIDLGRQGGGCWWRGREMVGMILPVYYVKLHGIVTMNLLYTMNIF
jgi:hypothetical protein